MVFVLFYNDIVVSPETQEEACGCFRKQMKLINPLLLLGHLLCPPPCPIHSLSHSLASSLPLSLPLSLSLLCWLMWWGETQALTALKLYSLRAVVIGGRWRKPPPSPPQNPSQGSQALSVAAWVRCPWQTVGSEGGVQCGLRKCQLSPAPCGLQCMHE